MLNKKRYILVILVLLLTATVSAMDSIPQPKVLERQKTKSAIRAEKARKNYIKLNGFANRWFLKGVDTTYIGLPRHPFKVALSGDFGSVLTLFNCDDVPYYESISSRMESNITPKLGFVVGYRNLNFGYSWNLYRGYSNFKFSIVQNAYGIEIQRRKTNYAKGYIDASAIDGKQTLSSSDMSVRTLFITAYYALNRKKFSMPAAFNQSFIQKKSAGSVLFFADFINYDMVSNSDGLINKAGGVKEMELYQIAIGVGYGYNYTPNRGKILLHISAAPYLTVFNHLLITGDDRLYNPGAAYHQVFSRKVKPQYPVYVTGRVKAAFVYNINPYCVMSLHGVVNNIRFRSNDRIYDTDDELVNSTIPKVKMHIMTWDWNVVLNIGVRFG